MYINSKRSKSLISGLICMILLIEFFFSIFLIAKEADHKCTGTDCPICHEIQICVQTIKTMGTAIGVDLTLVVALFCATLIVATGKPIYVTGNTLVSLKVKLTN